MLNLPACGLISTTFCLLRLPGLGAVCESLSPVFQARDSRSFMAPIEPFGSMALLYSRQFLTMSPVALMPQSEIEKTSLTTLLQAWQHGDGAAFASLFDQVYDQLRTIAAHRLREVGGSSTLSPTELLHEAVIRIADAPSDLKNRAHFFATMSLTIRSTLVDHARARLAQKRGGHELHVTLTGASVGEESQIADLLSLDQALVALEKIDPRGSEVLHLTYFAGLEREEIAGVLAISVATVDRELRFARAWLHTTLGYGV